MATFSSAVRPDRRLKSWNTKPIDRRRKAALSLRLIPSSRAPSTTTSPLVASSRLPAMVSRLLFPEPLGPMIATSSPRATARSTSRRAWTSVWPSP